MFLPFENLTRRDVFKPQTTTEYKNEYRSHAVTKPHRFRPDIDSFVNRFACLPMQNETTNRHDYRAHPVKRPDPPNNVYIRLPYKMEASTSYSNEFTSTSIAI